MKGITSTERERRKSLRTETRYKRRSAEVERDAERDCPPITVIYIDREGRYRHGARCKAELDYIGTGKTGRTETEVRFWCSVCKESVALPLAVLDRVVRLGKDAQGRSEVRTDDSGGSGDNHWNFHHLRPQGGSTRFPRTVSVGENPSGRSCRLCGVPHLQLPRVK